MTLLMTLTQIAKVWRLANVLNAFVILDLVSEERAESVGNPCLNVRTSPSAQNCGGVSDT